MEARQEPRPYVARLAARLLLHKIWSLSPIKDPHTVLAKSLELATQDLKLTIERVPTILGDIQIAGVLSRLDKRIFLATRFRNTSQRFTCAHEIAHFMLHPGTVYFRDRELSAPGVHREYYEIEADAFAAEFLMPRNFLESVFCDMFGGPIDGKIPNHDLAIAVRMAKEIRTRWTPEEFAALDPLARASAIASVNAYRGRFFASLTDQFNVSQRAMGIQLLQMGLVK